jgi:glycerol uptake facilitator-like aquaporin
MSTIELKGDNGADHPERERSSTNDLLTVAQQKENNSELTNAKIEAVIQDKILKDKSPEAKAGRRRVLIRAAYGEFMCSLLFYAPIFCVIANGNISNWTPELITLSSAFVAGLQAVGISFAFSSVSGAQFNSAISFALWLTGKLSNRRVVLYIFVQLLASIMGMVVVACIFHGNLQHIYDDLAVTPADDNVLGKVFATEFFLTFFLTYVAFTVAFEDAEVQKKESMSFKTISDSKGLTLYASTPQSKTGFAPFSIGFTIFSLALIGGSSGGAFNPGRLFGPAIFSGKWDYLYLYWLGELLGASAAALLVNNLHRFGLKSTVRKDEVSAKDAVKSLGSNNNPAPSVDLTKNPLQKQ